MVQRRCPKCDALFDRKSTYDKHLKKKFDCSKNKEDNINNLNILTSLQKFANFCKDEKNNQIFLKNQNYLNISKLSSSNINLNELNVNNDNFYCSYCNKTFSSKYTLARHINDTCKIKKEQDHEKENIFKLLLEKDRQKDKEIKELKEQNKLLMKKIDNLINLNNNPKILKTITNNQSITNNDNKIINNQNNFIMVNFGKEDLSIIDEKIFIDRIIKKPMLSGVKIPDEVLKIIHFNPLYPQLSNIYISDINREKCMVFEDNEWKLSNIDNIPQIMDKVCIFSNEQINILKNKHPNNKQLQDRLRIIEKYNNMIDNDYVCDLKDDEINDNTKLIQRCQEFQKLTYNTLKNTLYHEGKKIKNVVKYK